MTGPLPQSLDDDESEVGARTYTLTADIPDRALAMRIAGALQDLVEPAPEALSLFEEHASGAGAPLWRIEAYYPLAPDAGSLRSALEELLGEPIAPFETTTIADRDWVARAEAALPPIKAGRFTVYGRHDSARVARGPNAILIEAGEAFGTARHPTTLGCLMAIGALARRRSIERALDLGCGTGILAIATARVLPRARIVAVDIDQRSVAVALANSRLNGVAARVLCVCADGVDTPSVRRHAPFGLVVANILAEPLIALARDFRRVCAPGGTVILSGLLTREAPAVIAAARAQGLALDCHRRLDGWSTLVLVNRAVARARGRA